jgi:hypothetical protein
MGLSRTLQAAVYYKGYSLLFTLGCFDPKDPQVCLATSSCPPPQLTAFRQERAVPCSPTEAGDLNAWVHVIRQVPGGRMQ